MGPLPKSTSGNEYVLVIIDRIKLKNTQNLVKTTQNKIKITQVLIFFKFFILFQGKVRKKWKKHL